MTLQKQTKYIIRITLLYLVSTIIYMPLILKEDVRRAWVFGFHHLWYLEALIIGLLLVCISRKLNTIITGIIAGLLFCIGVLLHMYHSLWGIEWIDSAASFVSRYGGCRNGVFFAYPLLVLGVIIRKHPLKINTVFLLFLTIISFIMATIESAYLKSRLGIYINCDLTFCGWLPAVPIFLLANNAVSPFHRETMRTVRKITDIAYIIHWWVKELIHCHFELSRSVGFL